LKLKKKASIVFLGLQKAMAFPDDDEKMKV
jgi:hypothetical protein